VFSESTAQFLIIKRGIISADAVLRHRLPAHHPGKTQLENVVNSPLLPAIEILFIATLTKIQDGHGRLVRSSAIIH